ncbi:kinase-like protein [Thelephora terrestris]|uniref:Kinase-like protein n=1 Tax=Thelephora terrestris TaxID=56493 RepID=A0A9P6HQ06_9AGAM|nr:kinase-like protein [Thelephora terrestris]
MFPTPSASRAGSEYEPSPPTQATPCLTHSHRPSRELHHTPSFNTTPLHPGSIISACEDGSSISLTLLRTLGQGSFSSVWLACDVSGTLEHLVLSRKASIKRFKSTTSDGIVRRKSSRRSTGRSGVSGTKPWKTGGGTSPPTTNPFPVKDGFDRPDCHESGGRLVAVKLTDRAMDDRTRVSFIREVEVLKHVSHPNIVSFMHSFTTSTYYCLALEHIDGPELLDFINSDEKYAQLDEPFLRQFWGELCKAVGWMHSVALVHRDIKLENILLTGDLNAAGAWPSGPLVKLTDFGLSRFVDPDNPWLTTRCGSESYAAPEIVMGSRYDGRQTDAWACGVVLYALTTRRLPFDSLHGGFSSKSRKAMLLRIAKCEYTWPKGENEGSALWQILGVKRIIGRLLVRDPQQRWKIDALWQDEWMTGEGAPAPPPRSGSPPIPHPLHQSPQETYPELPAVTHELIDNDEDEDDEDGLIVGEDIPSVATQENF